MASHGAGEHEATLVHHHLPCDEASAKPSSIDRRSRKWLLGNAGTLSATCKPCIAYAQLQNDIYLLPENMRRCTSRITDENEEVAGATETSVKAAVSSIKATTAAASIKATAAASIKATAAAASVKTTAAASVKTTSAAASIKATAATSVKATAAASIKATATAVVTSVKATAAASVKATAATVATSVKATEAASVKTTTAEASVKTTTAAAASVKTTAAASVKTTAAAPVKATAAASVKATAATSVKAREAAASVKTTTATAAAAASVKTTAAAASVKAKAAETSVTATTHSVGHERVKTGKYQASPKTSSSPSYESGFSSGNSETSNNENLNKVLINDVNNSKQNSAVNTIAVHSQKNEKTDDSSRKNTRRCSIEAEQCSKKGGNDDSKTHGRKDDKNNFVPDVENEERLPGAMKLSSSNSVNSQRRVPIKIYANSASVKVSSDTPTFATRGKQRDMGVANIQPMTVPLLPLAPARVTATQRMRALSPTPGSSNRGHPSRSSSAQQAPVVLQLLKPNNQPVSITKIDMDRQELREWPSDEKISTSTNTTVTSGGSMASQQKGGATVLSLQNNHITKICPTTALSSVVLLDLYHNKLGSLHGLALLPALRVLLVAKNRLTRLDGLAEVIHLEVLDLHGNQLQHLHGLSNLKKLRVLNAAGNLLREVSGLRGLDSLLELNLRRNLIRSVSDLHYLPRLQKLFLAHNEIFRYEDMSCVQGCLKLKELSLHHNPLSRHSLYFYIALTKFYRLKRLDEREIDLEMRKTAERMLQKAKDREKARSSRLHSAVSRANAICSARDNWNRLKVAHKRFRSGMSAATPVQHDKKASGEESKESKKESPNIVVHMIQNSHEDEPCGQGEELNTNSTLAVDNNQVQQIQEDSKAATQLNNQETEIVRREDCNEETTEVNIHDDIHVREPSPEKAMLNLVSEQAAKDQPEKSNENSTIKISRDGTDDYIDVHVEDVSTESSFDSDIVSNGHETSENAVERYQSSPNLLVTQATITDSGIENESPDEVTAVNHNSLKSTLLARSVSCWNLVLPIKNNLRIAQEAQITDKVPQAMPNNAKPRLKKPLVMPEKKPLRKSASSRSLVSLPEHRTIEKLSETLGKDSECLKNIENARPKTASYGSTKKMSCKMLYDKEMASSCDSLSSSESYTNSRNNLCSTATASSHAKLQSSKSTKSNEKVASGDPILSSNSNSNKNSAHLNKTNTNVGNSAGSMLQPPPLTHRHSVGSLNTSKNLVPTTLTNPNTATPATGLLRQQGKNYLAEIDSGMLNLYGQGALNCVDLQWDRSAAASATTAKFQYINFDEAITVFSKLRVKFPKLQNFVFEETHLARFGQLNALAELHQVRSVSVGQDGNPIVEHPQWRYYAIFRLSHWGLMVINGKPVSDEERQEAMVQFGALSQLAFMCLPRDHLTALMLASRSKSEGSNSEGVGEAAGGAAGLGAPHLQELIGKEALQYRQASGDPAVAEVSKEVLVVLLSVKQQIFLVGLRLSQLTNAIVGSSEKMTAAFNTSGLANAAHHNAKFMPDTRLKKEKKKLHFE
ncbi:Leucine-rich repeat domain L domain-like [Trinorchestia longiramus]|nr:Leucine-rich repeat domain L domain-like [Trinorchestia longiramus]